MIVRLSPDPFDPWVELAACEKANAALAGRYGATAVFLGTARDLNEGPERVSEIELEHYPGMTERELDAISRSAVERYGLLELLVIHRIGRLTPGDPIVLIAAWSAHRAPALDACRLVIEELKQRVTFWKRELTERGPRWVGPRSTDENG